MEEIVLSLDHLDLDGRSKSSLVREDDDVFFGRLVFQEDATTTDLKENDRGGCRGRRRRRPFRRRRNVAKSKGGGRVRNGSPFTLSLSLRVEKNVICLLLGRRVIKTLVRRTAGKNGANLVDLVYKLARITLGKREAKKLMKRTLNIIAEVSVLAIHRKMDPHLLDLMRTALLAPLKTFQDMQNNAQTDPPMTRSDQEVLFTGSLLEAEKALFILLQPLVQERTLKRFAKVARTLRDPAIVGACLNREGLPGVRKLLQEMCNTVEEMAEEARERMARSKSKPPPRPLTKKGSKSKSKGTTTPIK